MGLLHDLGKVLVLFGEPQVSGMVGRGGPGDPPAAGGPSGGAVTPPLSPQWAVVGDTFPVGCKVQKSVVYGDSTFRDNPDTKDPRYR